MEPLKTVVDTHELDALADQFFGAFERGRSILFDDIYNSQYLFLRGGFERGINTDMAINIRRELLDHLNRVIDFFVQALNQGDLTIDAVFKKTENLFGEESPAAIYVYEQILKNMLSEREVSSFRYEYFLKKFPDSPDIRNLAELLINLFKEASLDLEVMQDFRRELKTQLRSSRDYEENNGDFEYLCFQVVKRALEGYLNGEFTQSSSLRRRVWTSVCAILDLE